MQPMQIACTAPPIGKPLKFEHRVLLVLFPPAAALSGNLIVFRVIIALAIPVLLASHLSGTAKVPRSVRRFFGVALFWICWGVLSLGWALDAWDAVRELSWLCLGACIIATFALSANSPQAQDAIRLGWLLAYVLAAAVAIWEVRTGNHLESSYIDQVPGYALNRTTVLSTFGNPNNYGAFLLLSSSFLLSFFILSAGSQKLLAFLLLISLPALLVLSEARLAMIGLLVEFALVFWFRRRRSDLVLILVLCCVTIGAGIFYEPMAQKFRRIGVELQAGGSTAVRRNLLLNSLSFLWETGGVGLGAGSFETRMKSGNVPFDTADGMGGRIVNPHNFWMEILSQYGILVFAAFLWWFLGSLRLSRRLRRLAARVKDPRERVLAELCFVAFAGYVFASVENSAYMEQSMNWVFLGSMMGMLTSLSGTLRAKANAQN